MRYIFFVQSEISYLVCLAIIERRGLSACDVVFVPFRGQTVGPGFCSFAAPDFLFHRHHFFSKKPLRYFRWKSAVRAWIDQVTLQQDHCLFVNKLNLPFLGEFQKCKDCKEINVYEEGLAAYWKGIVDRHKQERSFWHPHIADRSGHHRFPPLPADDTYSSAYTNAYATQSSSMRGFPRRVEVDISGILAENSHSFDTSNIPHGTGVFALPNRHAFLASEEAFLKLARCLKHFQNIVGADRALFKPHPDYILDMKFLAQLFEAARIDVGLGDSKVIHNLPLELLSLHREDITIGFVVSSLAAYSHLLESKMISYAPAVFGDEYPQTQIMRKLHHNLTFVSPEELDGTSEKA